MALKSVKRNELSLSQRDRAALVAIYRASIISAGHLVRLFGEVKATATCG